MTIKLDAPFKKIINSPNAQDLRECIIDKGEDFWIDYSTDPCILLQSFEGEKIKGPSVLLIFYGLDKIEILYEKDAFDLSTSYIGHNGTDDMTIYNQYIGTEPAPAYGYNLFSRETAYNAALHFINTGGKLDTIDWVLTKDNPSPDSSMFANGDVDL